MDVRDHRPGRVARGLGERDRLDARAPLEGAVEPVEEVPTALRVVLPGVLAVEDDADGRAAVEPLRAPRLADPLHAPHEVLDRLRGRDALVGEADHVGERTVAEEHGELAPDPRRDAPRPVDRREARRVRAEGAEQHTLVARRPGDALGGEHLGGLGRDRSLRRPHPRRRAAEAARVRRDRLAHVPARVLGVREAGREVHLGERPARGVRVADEGQDRVVVGRGGELDLAALGEGAPARDDLREEAALRVEQRVDVAAVEVALLLAECAHRRVLGCVEAHPREVEVDLEVGEVLVAEGPGEPAEIHAAQVPAALLEQLVVAADGPHVHVPVDHEEAAQQGATLVERKLRRGARGELEEPILRAPGDVVLELLEEDRCEVHGAADARVPLEHRRHVGVRAGRVQTHPR